MLINGDFSGTTLRTRLRRLLPWVSTAALGAFFVFALPALAQDPGLEALRSVGFSATDPRILIARIIRVALSLLGLVAIIIILYGGFLWMTARGDSKQIETAKKVLQNGLIGLVIIFTSYTIVSFIFAQFLGLRGLNPFAPLDTRPRPPCENCIDLGGGIIEDHYPERNATGVPRDIAVSITFKEAVRVVAAGEDNEETSFIANAVPKGQPFQGNPCPVRWCGELNADVFALQGQRTPDGDLEDVTDLQVYTADAKSFTLIPTAPLGSENGSTRHVATVTTELRKANGDAALVLGDYEWQFTVSNVLDLVPPSIERITPAEGTTAPTNSVIQIDFTEPVNPVAASGVYDPANGETFQNIVVLSATTGEPVRGSFTIGNGYRRVQFTTFEKCKTCSTDKTLSCQTNAQCAAGSTCGEQRNSCNQEMFCLPSGDLLRVVVRAATICATGKACPSGANGSIFDGIVDMSRNSLDGERALDKALPAGDGKAEGPDGTKDPLVDAPPFGDTYWWDFGTSNRVILGGLEIVGVSPLPEAAGVRSTDPFIATFNRQLSLAKPYQDPVDANKVYDPALIYESPDEQTWAPYPYGFTIRQQSVDGPCGNESCLQEDLRLVHQGLEDPNAAGAQAEKSYEPRIGSTIRDVYQQCFSPAKGPAATPGTVNLPVNEEVPVTP